MALSPEAVTREWFDRLWNRGDEATIDRLLHADGVIHGLPTPDGQPLRGTLRIQAVLSRVSRGVP